MLIPFVLSYAEIHYHLRFLYPKYFRKEPEIIADIPIRCIKSISRKLPVLIIIKDSHLFPVKVNSVEVNISSKQKDITEDFNINLNLSQRYYSKILDVDLKDIQTEQILQITVKIKIEVNGKVKTIRNDNFADIPKKPFRCYYAENTLPLPELWFAGDVHYHSIYTSDQVEFGADIKSTVKMAKVLGLSWLFITDHSYDLDDQEECYTKNDPAFPKWEKLHMEINNIDEIGFNVIAGEEVSIGNSKGKNVHMLAINHNEFLEGYGDSAEVWFKNKPVRFLKEIKDLHSDINLFIAAHPNEEVPFMQKLTLRRGNWSKTDFLESGIKFLQVINNSRLPDIFASINYWKLLLLEGYRFFILAGNDAHGNFNIMRQIKTPFMKLFASDDQVFGKFFTAFKFIGNEPLKAIKNGEIIVSNGPFLSFWLKNKKFSIGSVANCQKANLIFETRTSHEFGNIKNVTLYIGDISSKKEIKILNPKNNIVLELPKNGYVRMNMSTKNGGWVFTNPVWIE